MHARKIELLLMVCVFFLNELKAQTVKMQQGILYKQGTSLRLGNVKVFNKRSQQTVKSNLYGVFNMVASLGDSLEISSAGFQTTNSMVTDFSTKVLYLIPSIELPEVVVNENLMLNDLQEVKKGYRDKGVFYTGTPHYYYLFLKPMTFIYENFKSEVKNARKFNKYAKLEVDSYEISSRFNDDLIKSVVPVKDVDLFNFKLKYWPFQKQVDTWNEYDLINYIKRSFEDFKKNNSKKAP